MIAATRRRRGFSWRPFQARVKERVARGVPKSFGRFDSSQELSSNRIAKLIFLLYKDFTRVSGCFTGFGNKGNPSRTSKSISSSPS
jgi:hypothetical protein